MREYSLEELWNFITPKEDTYPTGWNRVDVETPFEVKPQDFVNYAVADLGASYNHNLINSLSNIKRAVDCQIDSLLIAFGMYKFSKDKNWKFPDKIDFLKKLDILAPRILRKINKKRNILEHEFQQPSKEDVEDAIDVIMLFIGYTNKYLESFKSMYELVNENSEEMLYVRLNYKDNRIAFVEPTIINDELKYEIKKTVQATSEDYVNYLKWYLELDELLDY